MPPKKMEKPVDIKKNMSKKGSKISSFDVAAEIKKIVKAKEKKILELNEIEKKLLKFEVMKKKIRNIKRNIRFKKYR